LSRIKNYSKIFLFSCISLFVNDIFAQLNYFSPVSPTGVFDAVVIQNASINGTPILTGDEIAIFDDNVCVGASVFAGSYPLTVTAHLEYTPPGQSTLPGAKNGNPMIFKVWQNSSNTEVLGIPTFIIGGNFGEPLTVVSSLTATIALPTISINDVSDNENVGQMRFTITLSSVNAASVSVDYRTKNDTAISPVDYTSSSGTLTIPGGNSTGTINVTINDDTMYENNETFIIELSNPTNATIADDQAVGTIFDDDNLPILAISDETEIESAGTMVFTVTLSSISNLVVSVYYFTNNGTAVSPADYTNTSGTLTLPVGTTSGTITVPIIDDSIFETAEIFSVNLSNVINATILGNQGVGTILDNDNFPNIIISDETENENVGTMNFVVSLSSANTSVVSVNYQTHDGTAVSPTDFSVKSGTLNISVGETTGTIGVPIIDDAISESPENFSVKLSDATNATITDNTGFGTIIDNDSDPHIIISDQVENESVGTMNFTVTLSSMTSSIVNVYYQTNNGTAISPDDYTSKDGSLYILAGNTTALISVPIIDDSIVESNETFSVNLTNVSNATIMDNQGIGTIIDNDGEPKVYISDEIEIESATIISFTVSLSNAGNSTISISYQTIDGTAVAQEDYVATHGTMTIPAGQTTGALSVPIINDSILEADENFYVVLTNSINATILDNLGAATIIDNDGIANISISDEIENESIGMMRFSIILSSLSTSIVSVNYSTTNGTAIYPEDYTAKSGTLTIPVGASTGTIDIPIIEDAFSEPNEYFYVNLTNPLNANIEDNQGVGTIVDDDGMPSISISDETEDENVGIMSFTVTLSKESSDVISIYYQTHNASAIAFYDYDAKSGTLIIPVNTTSGTINIPIIDDALGETNEHFFVDLSNPTNAILGDGQGDGAIIDNDMPAISISEATENEHVGTMGFIVTLSNPSVLTVSLDYQTQNGTALAPYDYVSTAGTLNIPADSTIGKINVLVIDDYISEAIENFFVVLNNPANGTLTGDQGIGTIVDNDAADVVMFGDPIPKNHKLYQNHPNPFNNTTRIRFDLPNTEHVQLRLFNLNGHLIKTLIDSRMDAGIHEFEWKTSELSSGIYFCQLIAYQYIETTKIILQK